MVKLLLKGGGFPTREYESDTIVGCLNQFEPDLKFKVVKFILRVESGGRVAEVKVYPVKMRQLLANELARVLMEKFILRRLK